MLKIERMKRISASITLAWFAFIQTPNGQYMKTALEPTKYACIVETDAESRALNAPAQAYNNCGNPICMPTSPTTLVHDFNPTDKTCDPHANNGAGD